MQPDKDTVDAIVGLIRRNPTLIGDLTELLDADSDAKNARLRGDDTDRWSAPADDLADIDRDDVDAYRFEDSAGRAAAMARRACVSVDEQTATASMVGSVRIA